MKAWQKKEKKDAQLFKGKVTPRSGGLSMFKGDVVTKNWLLDCKTTDKKGYNITDAIWSKLYYEALRSHKKPCLSVQLLNYDTEFVILDKNDFIELLEKNGDF